jgi:hypothetical protein
LLMVNSPNLAADAGRPRAIVPATILAPSGRRDALPRFVYDDYFHSGREAMRTKLFSLLLGGFVAATLSLAAHGQGGPGAAAAGTDKVVDCGKARNPERCEARKAARAACQDKQGPERRKCVENQLPPPDCAKSANPGRCSAMLGAREACKDKTGPAHRQCMREQAKATAPATKP